MLTQKDDDKNEEVVYYLSKRFHDYETRYTPIKKVMLCTCLGRTEIETYYFTLSNIGGRKNGPIEIYL